MNPSSTFHDFYEACVTTNATTCQHQHTTTLRHNIHILQLREDLDTKARSHGSLYGASGVTAYYLREPSANNYRFPCANCTHYLWADLYITIALFFELQQREKQEVHCGCCSHDHCRSMSTLFGCQGGGKKSYRSGFAYVLYNTSLLLHIGAGCEHWKREGGNL